jgi:hypothetical protein
MTYPEAIKTYPLLSTLSYGDLVYICRDPQEMDSNIKKAAKIVLEYWRANKHEKREV